MENERRFRKTKHEQIDFTQIATVRVEPYYMRKATLERVEKGSEEEVWEFKKMVVQEGKASSAHQFGKGTKVQYRHDLRTHDGFLALEHNEEPNCIYSANYGSGKTSPLVEALLREMNVGEKCWFQMHGDLISTKYLVRGECYYFMLHALSIKPVPPFLERHLEDERVFNEDGSSSIKRSSPLEKCEAV